MPLKVYAIPVEFTVQASVYVLAETPESAALALEAGALDLTSAYSFDDETVWVEDGDRMKILDVVGERFTQEAPKAVPSDDYDPSDHPDWDEGEGEPA